MRVLIAVALAALANAPAQASPPPGRAHALQQEIGNEQSKVRATYRDGRITSAQAGDLTSRLQAIGRAEKRAEHNGELADPAAYRALEANLAGITARMVRFENENTRAR